MEQVFIEQVFSEMVQMVSTGENPMSVLPDSKNGSASQTFNEPEDAGSDSGMRFFESLRRKWWYYGLVSLIAGACAYFVATEYGSNVYTAYTQVRANELPFPPGVNYFKPPILEDFSQYLNHPQVIDKLGNDYAIALDPTGKTLPIEDVYDRKTKIVTVKVTRDTPAEAAALANQVISEAIAQSLDERREELAASQRYYESLVSQAEAEAASDRIAKATKLESLRTRFANDANADFEFSEIRELVNSQRGRVRSLETELEDTNNLKSVLLENQKKLVNEIRSEIAAGFRAEIKVQATPFSASSSQAAASAEKLDKLDTLASKSINSIDELNEQLRDFGNLVGRPIELPREFANDLELLSADLYRVRKELILLPKKIESETKKLNDYLARRSEFEVAGEDNFENTPEILELTAEIERSERSVVSYTSALDWVNAMQKLDTPSFAHLSVATTESAIPDGNHKKLFAAVFGGLGALLSLPMLMFDILRSPDSPSERLSKDFGISTMAAHEILARTGKRGRLQANDPELRLLALRIQQSAKDARGSVVLFSSLADALSTAELTTTIASCLAAREEKVLVIDLETIAEHRQGKFQKLGRARLSLPNKSKQLATVNGDKKNAAKGEALVESDREKSAGQKYGLAAALSGATKHPEDVMIFHNNDGIDRLELGDAELPVEAFASPLMAKLMDRFRNEYSMVLLSGPAAKHLADVQMLASKCDGTLFVAPKRGNLSPIARRTIADLIENRNPIMGIVEIAD